MRPQLQLRHLFLLLAIIALAVQWVQSRLSVDSFRGEFSRGSDYKAWLWLTCVVIVATIFARRHRTAVRMATLVVLSVGLYHDRGTLQWMGWATLGVCAVAICCLRAPAVLPKLRRDTILGAMIPISLVIVVALQVDMQSRPSFPRTTISNLLRIHDALHNYKRRHGSYPPPYVCDKNGRRIHSWRALVLPHLRSVSWGDPLLGYRMDEPWDGPHNRLLADKAPWEFSPAQREVARDGRCVCFAVLGPLTHSLVAQRPGVKARDSELVNCVMITGPTIPHWSEPLDFEFYLNGTMVEPWPAKSGSEIENDRYVAQLGIYPGPGAYQRLPKTPPEKVHWLELLTLNRDERVEIVNRAEIKRDWGPPSPLRPMRQEFALLWTVLSLYLFLDVTLSFLLFRTPKRVAQQSPWETEPQTQAQLD